MIRGTASIASMIAALLASQGAAEQARQKTFATPEAAAEALFVAVKAGDEQALSRIVGGETDILSSNDPGQDSQERRTFVEKYAEMHRIGSDGRATVLFVGAENWPFPLPLASRNGGWFFDTKNGREEILLRRIGQNELSTLETCRALDGLDGQDVARVLGKAPVNGYYFRKVAAKGGPPAFVAYPVAYGSSGIMTFVVRPGAPVYERDLGPHTANLATAVSGDLDGTWHAVE